MSVTVEFGGRRQVFGAGGNVRWQWWSTCERWCRDQQTSDAGVTTERRAGGRVHFTAAHVSIQRSPSVTRCGGGGGSQQSFARRSRRVLSARAASVPRAITTPSRRRAAGLPALPFSRSGVGSRLSDNTHPLPTAASLSFFKTDFTGPSVL